MASESDKIADSEFTIKWLEEILQKDSNTKALITHFSSTEVGFGRGFLSQILIVSLTWDSDSDVLPKSVALKIPTIKQFMTMMDKMDDDDPIKIQFMKQDPDAFPIGKAHKCEVAVYDVFRQFPPKGLKIPKSYFGRNMALDHQGVLVFEDLSEAVGCKLTDGMTHGQLMEIAEALASLHAYSLTNKEWNTGKINMTMLDLQGDQIDLMEFVSNSVPQLKEWNPDFFDPLADNVRDWITCKEDLDYILKINEKMGLPDVFCNGDLHAQNMMWVKDKDGKASDELMSLIDWQICHPGNIGEDFARCFTSSVHADVRRNHYMEILQHYYSCLTKYLGTKPPYTFDQVLESYKRCFRYGACCIVPGFPMITKVPELLGDNPEETIKKCMEQSKAIIEDVVAYEQELSG